MQRIVWVDVGEYKEWMRLFGSSDGFSTNHPSMIEYRKRISEENERFLQEDRELVKFWHRFFDMFGDPTTENCRNILKMGVDHKPG